MTILCLPLPHRRDVSYGDIRVPERFWNKILPEPNSGCWLWTGSVNSGYGNARLPGGRTGSVHRFMYLTLIGTPDDGLELDHLCRIRCCVNPDHLEPVTPRVNTLRSNGPAAICARETHCKYGHEFNASTTRITKEGFRTCKICEKTFNQHSVRIGGKKTRLPRTIWRSS